MDKSFIIIFSLISFGTSFPNAPKDDPCLGTPCGKGARCQAMSTIAVCICPTDSTGDPFVECRPSLGPQVNQDFNPPIPMNHPSNSRPSQHTPPPPPSPPSSTFRSNQYPFGERTEAPAPIHSPITPPPPPPPPPPHSHPNQNHPGASNKDFLTQHQYNIPFKNDFPYNPNAHINHNDYQPNIMPQNRHQMLSHNSNNNREYHQTPMSNVKDPLGKYANCKSINNIVVCADDADQERIPDQNLHYRNMNEHQNFPQAPPPPPMNNMPNHHSPSRNHPNPHMHNVYGEFEREIELNRQKQHNSHQMHQNLPHSNQNHHHMGRDPEYRHVHQSNDFNRFDKPHNNHHPTPNLQNQDPMCRKFCGEGSVCRLHLNRPICGCPKGTYGDPSIKCSPIEDNTNDEVYHNKNQQGSSHHHPSQNRGNEPQKDCLRHSECRDNEVCHKMKCTDPCSENAREKDLNLCQANSKCYVMEHTPLCACLEGFFGNPYAGCAH